MENIETQKEKYVILEVRDLSQSFDDLFIFCA